MERKFPGRGKQESDAAPKAGGFLWDIESGIVTCDSIARQLIGFELGPDCDLLRLNDILSQISAADKSRVEQSLSQSILVDVPFVIPFEVGNGERVEMRGESCASHDDRKQVVGVIAGTEDGQGIRIQETGLDALIPLLNEALTISRAENLSFLTWLLRMALIEAGKVPGAGSGH
jgi:hypothetical protein